MWHNWLVRAEECFLVGSMAVNVALVFLQVVMRYVFQNSLSWSEELARYIFLWQCWIGASYAASRGSHLRVEVLVSRFTGKGRLAFEIFIALVWLGFGAFLAYYGARLTLFLFGSGQRSAAMRIPMGWAYASVLIGCALMTIHLLEKLLRLLDQCKEGKSS